MSVSRRQTSPLEMRDGTGRKPFNHMQKAAYQREEAKLICWLRGAPAVSWNGHVWGWAATICMLSPGSRRASLWTLCIWGEGGWGGRPALSLLHTHTLHFLKHRHCHLRSTNPYQWLNNAASSHHQYFKEEMLTRHRQSLSFQEEDAASRSWFTRNAETLGGKLMWGKRHVRYPMWTETPPGFHCCGALTLTPLNSLWLILHTQVNCFGLLLESNGPS